MYKEFSTYEQIQFQVLGLSQNCPEVESTLIKGENTKTYEAAKLKPCVKLVLDYCLEIKQILYKFAEMNM